MVIIKYLASFFTVIFSRQIVVKTLIRIAPVRWIAVHIVSPPIYWFAWRLGSRLEAIKDPFLKRQKLTEYDDCGDILDLAWDLGLNHQPFIIGDKR